MIWRETDDYEIVGGVIMYNIDDAHAEIARLEKREQESSDYLERHLMRVRADLVRRAYIIPRSLEAIKEFGLS